jgi:hypothetical protein
MLKQAIEKIEVQVKNAERRFEIAKKLSNYSRMAELQSYKEGLERALMTLRVLVKEKKI